MPVGGPGPSGPWQSHILEERGKVAPLERATLPQSRDIAPIAKPLASLILGEL